MRLELAGNRLSITNRSPYPLLLDTLTLGDQGHDVGVALAAGATLALASTSGPDPVHARLPGSGQSRPDCAPPARRRPLSYPPGQVHGLFDIGVDLATNRPSEQEERLRWELREHPSDAAAAAGLARLLYRRGAMAEAEGYFRRRWRIAAVWPMAASASSRSSKPYARGDRIAGVTESLIFLVRCTATDDPAYDLLTCWQCDAPHPESSTRCIVRRARRS